MRRAFTDKNTRYCVNSVSLEFQKAAPKSSVAKAYFAGGCFWGVEHHLEKLSGVKEVYAGNSEKSQLSKAFFEIRDPTQKNGQGPDCEAVLILAVRAG